MIEDFDEFLASALRARPAPVARIDLAAEAIRRARARDVRRAGLAQLARWTLLSRLAAAVLILATLVSGYFLWPSAGASTLEAGASASALVGSTSTYAYTPDPTLIGAVIFLGALVAVAVASLFHADRATPVLMQSL
jgi:hypothetical protein